MMKKLLVIDDERTIRHAFQRAFQDEDTQVILAATGEEGEELFQKLKPDVAIVDFRLPDKTGLECFQVLRQINPRVPVIFITGHGTVDAAIEATKLGAYDYLFKPLELTAMQELLAKAFELSRMVQVQPVLSEGTSFQEDAIVGRCRAMQEVYKSVGQVAPQNITVLLQGESGTGKEVIAQTIYHHSSRPNAPFFAVNCAAIPDALLESEIFGHEKGAFTDADRKRIGKLQQANGGTLFLDEVGDMSPLTQAKLLRVLQDQTFEPVGSSQSIKVDVRIIAASNHDLKKLVSEGLFRADLYFRISTVTIQLPPLRERGKDLELLANHFVQKYSQEYGKQVRSIAPGAIESLSQYHWPGNVRELESVIKQSLLESHGSVLLPTFLPDLSDDTRIQKSDAPLLVPNSFLSERMASGSKNLYSEAIAIADRQILDQVLKHTSGNQLLASQILGISRVTLRSKLRSLGIDPSDYM